MELKQKGSVANAGVISGMLVKMKWTSEADFDLACLYFKKDGTHDMLYFGNRDEHNLNKFPFFQLSEDAGVGDTGGDNEEQMIIAKIDQNIEKVYIICWDYPAIQKGKPARFKSSDVKLSMVDDSGNDHVINLDTGEMGNLAVLACIDNSSPIGATIENVSKAGTLKGFKKSEQIIDVINS